MPLYAIVVEKQSGSDLNRLKKQPIPRAQLSLRAFTFEQMLPQKVSWMIHYKNARSIMTMSSFPKASRVELVHGLAHKRLYFSVLVFSLPPGFGRGSEVLTVPLPSQARAASPRTR